ncbi:MAG: aldolase [Anaerolineae bacterium]|nr:aldolase [Chloroflexota bacterium]MBV6435155.1 2-keto-3-deoxy-L-rhamnonate aldolase [Anaerolineae bacterium]MDL1917103.1 aldolase [Anaerolineae bacterium CFX4]MBW7878976.1 aldolase [Anaerolineae bacterium]MCO6443404.1 aldolase [Anaerolineae bacterium]
MRGQELKQQLKAGKPVFGVCMEGYGQPRWPKFFANYAPIDYVFLDSEHAPANRETIAWACQCYAAYGIAPLVRIPDISASQAAMVLDAGAHGVIVPYLETVEQAREVVGAAKYRPLKGAVLAEAVASGTFPNAETKQYLDARNVDSVLVVMIESTPGIANLPDILAVGGIDAVMIGPHDLSINLGVPEQYEHPRFIEALDAVIGACKRAGVGAGMHIPYTDAKSSAAVFNRGMTFISFRGDTLFIAEALRHELGYLRSAIKTV